MDSSRTHRKANVRRWKPLPSNGIEDATVDTREREREKERERESVCVCVCNDEMWIVVTHCVKDSNEYGHQYKTPSLPTLYPRNNKIPSE
jgi:hypothetical protein